MDVAEKVIGVSIALVVGGVMVPMGLNQIANSTLTNVDPAVQTMFLVILPVLAVIGIAVAFWKM